MKSVGHLGEMAIEQEKTEKTVDAFAKLNLDDLRYLCYLLFKSVGAANSNLSFSMFWRV
jgi:hypothetical protein